MGDYLYFVSSLCFKSGNVLKFTFVFLQVYVYFNLATVYSVLYLLKGVFALSFNSIFSVSNLVSYISWTNQYLKAHTIQCHSYICFLDWELFTMILHGASCTHWGMCSRMHFTLSATLLLFPGFLINKQNEEGWQRL